LKGATDSNIPIVSTTGTTKSAAGNFAFVAKMKASLGNCLMSIKQGEGTTDLGFFSQTRSNTYISFTYWPSASYFNLGYDIT